MTFRKIATIGHPVLRTPARAVAMDELKSAGTQSLIDDLIDTMHDANGAGLAANQVFEPVQICVIEVRANPRYPYMPAVPLTVLVNPRIETLSAETFENYEGCLSVPNLRGLVPRAADIRVRAWDRDGRDVDLGLRGITAGTFQHEIDHLNGTLFVDRVSDPRTLTTWTDFERFHQADWIARAREIVSRYGS